MFVEHAFSTFAQMNETDAYGRSNESRESACFGQEYGHRSQGVTPLFQEPSPLIDIGVWREEINGEMNERRIIAKREEIVNRWNE